MILIDTQQCFCSWLRTQNLDAVVQLDDVDGEIDLASCVNVSDCEVEKNYGLQIQVCATVLEYGIFNTMLWSLC